jgi:Ca2+-dependent lipid-binding protein
MSFILDKFQKIGKPNIFKGLFEQVNQRVETGLPKVAEVDSS